MSSLGKNGHSGSGNVRLLTGQVEKVKMAANVEFESENYDAAVSLYNRALVLHRAPHPVLCGNRAAALMKRAWDGDIYAAARDCLQALALDPAHVKAHLRLAQCLLRSWSGLQRRPSASASTIIKSAIRSSLNPKLSYNWPEIWR